LSRTFCMLCCQPSPFHPNKSRHIGQVSVMVPADIIIG